MQKDKAQRLGSKGGADEVINHPWFEGLDWEAIKNKEAKTPYVPPQENYGLDNFDEMFTNEDIKLDEEEMQKFNTSFEKHYTGKQTFFNWFRLQL